MLLALPLVALFVLLLAYYRLFTSPVVVGLIIILYVAVSLRNRRKFKNKPQN